MAKYQDENNLTHGVAEPVTEYGIPVAVSDIWNAILALSPSNRQWLREHLIEQEEDDIEYVSNEELAACYSIEEAEEQLLQMVHEHFSTAKVI